MSVKEPRTDEKAVWYQTHWKHYHREFLKAWALMPLFGIGFFKLRKLNRKLETMVYKVYNDRIEIGMGNERTTLSIPALRSVKKQQTQEQRKHGLADIVLTTESATYRLEGLEQADALEDVLYIAIRTEERRRALEEKAKGDHKIDPGGLDQMNYLTGLWQQGMISDEDFERERAKFEPPK